MPLWARSDDSDRLLEEDVVNARFIAFFLQVFLQTFSRFFSFVVIHLGSLFLTLFVVVHLGSLFLTLQLLRPWNPAFGIKYSHNQIFVMFKDWAPPSRLRSWIKRDIMSRRSHTHFESCKRIVSARAGDNGNNESDWFNSSADAMEEVMPHCVRSLFYDGAAFDMRMQRAVRAYLLMSC